MQNNYGDALQGQYKPSQAKGSTRHAKARAVHATPRQGQYTPSQAKGSTRHVKPRAENATQSQGQYTSS